MSTKQRRIHVVVNPAAGQDTPVLGTFNSIFREYGLDWDLSITKKAGDAYEQARKAAEDGVDIVAAYGGDGTVAEVASGLIGMNTPLLILPGGTANVMSVELGLPTDLTQACRLVGDPNSVLRPVDMGLVNEHNFILRVGIGFEAAMVENADRDLKDRLGVFAYLWSALQNLKQPEIAHYQLTLDGKEIECEGLTCIVANSANLGLTGLSLVPGASISDGMLDVVIIQQASLRSLFDVIGSVTGLKQLQAADIASQASELANQVQQNLQYWQAKEVLLTAQPAQTVQYDGEVLGKEPIHCTVIPQAVPVITPAPAPAPV